MSFWARVGNFIKRLFGSTPRPAPIPPPPPPPPVVVPPPPPTRPKLPYGFYYEQSERWGDYSDEVRDKTNLLLVENKNQFQSVSDEPGGLYFPKMRAFLARELAPEGKRKFIFDLGLHQPDILIRKCLTEIAPYADKLLGIILADEPDWAAEDLERKLRVVRDEMKFVGINTPLGVVLSEGQVEGEHLHEVEGLDWVGCEVYLEPERQDSGTVDLQIQEKINWYKSQVPADKKIMWVGMGYDRNGAWRRIDTLTTLQGTTFDAVDGDPRTFALVYFAYGRPGGVRDHPELREAHLDIWNEIENG